ncbi:hypothetical protein ETA_03990 [Erwinia tasmaniensis Et1/99]|uniref:Uncharacterized protein n=1 Tax=Erwinia tasmaniensis (strain DSM 17950 / CFBP 7177 / CIP 109463 / NCPPB 4357 / Et1/99) TaxID=465817 RepID=B2VGL3_ERWT9|nr:hypothetical protein ETA_03990 [Erwinia tasmaniensis Et1/99]
MVRPGHRALPTGLFPPSNCPPSAPRLPQLKALKISLNAPRNQCRKAVSINQKVKPCLLKHRIAALKTTL